LVHTGQNYDYELNQIFFEDLSIRKPDYFLEAVGNNAAQAIARVIEKSDQAMEKEEQDALKKLVPNVEGFIREVESFVKSLLVGIAGNDEEEIEQNERHKIVFGVLDENESGEITLDELGKFLRELFKE
jgi:hypothetical protein